MKVGWCAVPCAELNNAGALSREREALRCQEDSTSMHAQYQKDGGKHILG